jgi:hypothetical protein
MEADIDLTIKNADVAALTVIITNVVNNCQPEELREPGRFLDLQYLARKMAEGGERLSGGASRSVTYQVQGEQLEVRLTGRWATKFQTGSLTVTRVEFDQILRLIFPVSGVQIFPLPITSTNWLAFAVTLAKRQAVRKVSREYHHRPTMMYTNLGQPW